MQEKLTALLDELYGEWGSTDFANRLIANDVVIPVRCKNCVWAEKCGDKYECMHDHGLVELLDENDFCSYGEAKE